MTQGRVFNIQHFSVHDGPGVRTVVFFKGCNLSCLWCHNPESISSRKSLMFYEEKCIGCGSCFEKCPEHCHFLEREVHSIRHRDCRMCGLCAENCFLEALVSVGEDVNVSYVMEAILSNKPYFANSGGGVTFSGGECMLQIDFLRELLISCKEHGVHTAVDTAGDVPWEFFEMIRPYADLFLYDIKSYDPEVHRRLTGRTNYRIIKNFSSLYESGASIIVRIPFIKGYNDEEMEKLAFFMQKFPEVKTEILPYHALGDSKYDALSMERRIDWKAVTHTTDEIQRINEMFNNGGGHI